MVIVLKEFKNDVRSWPGILLWNGLVVEPEAFGKRSCFSSLQVNP